MAAGEWAGLEDTGLYEDPGYMATVETMCGGGGGRYRGGGAMGGDYGPYGGSGVVAGFAASGYRRGNTWSRGRQQNVSSPTATGAAAFDELERLRKLNLERAALEAKRESQLEQIATLAARIEDEKKAAAWRVTLAAAAKRQRSSDDGEVGFGDTIGDYYRGARDQQKRARVDVGLPASGKKLHAVARGRRTGVFGSWEEACGHVHGFSGALHKAFRGREEAIHWMISNSGGGDGGGARGGYAGGSGGGYGGGGGYSGAAGETETVEEKVKAANLEHSKYVNGDDSMMTRGVLLSTKKKKTPLQSPS